MARARIRDEWHRAASISAAALNANPYRRKPVKASELDPFADDGADDESVFDEMERDGVFGVR